MIRSVVRITTIVVAVLSMSAVFASVAAAVVPAARNLICNGCVGTRDLKAESVTSAKIASGTITGIDIANGTIHTNDIMDATIMEADMNFNPVTQTELDTVLSTYDASDLVCVFCVGSFDIDFDAVQSGHINDGTIVTADIADGTITSDDVDSSIALASDISALEQGLIVNRRMQDTVKVVNDSTHMDLAGFETIDGVGVVDGDRVLLTAQNDDKDNGIYVVDSDEPWTRATDADGSGEISSGMQLNVEQGATNAESLWITSHDGQPTVGQDPITFRQVFPSVGAGLARFGNTIQIDDAYNGQSSIDTVGVVSNGTWDADTIAITAGGTGATSVNDANSNLMPSADFTDADDMGFIGDARFAFADTTNASFTSFLPPPSAGRVLFAQNKTGAGNWTLDTPGIEEINGQGSATAGPGQWVYLVGNGSDWVIINTTIP